MVFRRSINGRDYYYTSERDGEGNVKSVYLGPAKKRRPIFRPVIISVMIVALLILSGPAQAITVSTASDKSIYKLADNANFTVSVNIETSEKIPVQNLTLLLNGTGFTRSCIFSPNGTSLSGCGNLTITAINVQGYATSNDIMYGYGYGYDISGASWEYGNETFGSGYGYGYTEGYGSTNAELKYNITWNLTGETSLTSRNYTAVLSAYAQDATGDKIYSSALNPTEVTLDVDLPTVSITYPLNITYDYDVTNYTFVSTDGFSANITCSYSLDGNSTSLDTTSANSSFSGSLTLANGMHNLTATCADIAGNSVTTSMRYFTINKTSNVGASYPGTVGQNVSEIATESNLTGIDLAAAITSALSEMLNIDNIGAGIQKQLNFTNGTQTNIKSVTITSNVDASNASVTVQTLTSKPTATSGFAISGAETVYRYLEFNSTLSDDEIDEVIIEFQIEKSWLEENGYTTDQIKLTRFNNGAWTELPTTLVSSDSIYYYFEAVSPGFSYYAIVVTEQAEEESVTTVVSAQIVCGDDVCEGSETCSNCEADCGACVSGEEAETTAQQAEQAESLTWMIIIGLLAVILIIAGIAYYYKEEIMAFIEEKTGGNEGV